MAVQLSVTSGRLGSVQAQDRDEPRRDPLPYAIDLRDALTPLSGAPPPHWQDAATLPPPTPPLAPAPPPRGEPRVVLDAATAQAWARHRQREWFVAYARDHARRRVLRVTDGWFVAFDGGENGGSLWWYPTRPGRGTELWRGNVRWLAAMENRVVALGGLAHMGTDGGVALWFTPVSGRWSLERHERLLAAPTAVVEVSGRVLTVATRRSVERVTGDGAEVLARVDFPDAPTSLVVAGADVALGMRVFAFVVRDVGGGSRVEIYVPPGCPLRDDGYLCRCGVR